MFLAQQADPNLTSLLDRLGNGEVFALSSMLITAVSVSLVFIVLIVFSTIRSIRRTSLRHTFVRSMIDQGMPVDDVIRLAETTFGSDGCRTKRVANQSATAHVSVPPAKTMPVPQRS